MSDFRIRKWKAYFRDNYGKISILYCKIDQWAIFQYEKWTGIFFGIITTKILILNCKIDQWTILQEEMKDIIFPIILRRIGKSAPGRPGQSVVHTPCQWSFCTPTLLTHIHLSEFDFITPDCHLLGKNTFSFLCN